MTKTETDKLPVARRTPVTLPNLADIDLRLLRVFCVVVESGGFSTAQSELKIGQSTISTHMSELEARLGIHLCRRGRSGFALTQHGEIVYEACQKLFASLEDFRSEVNEIRGKLVGALTIGLLDTTITDENNNVAKAIGIFKKAAPDVQINLIVTSPTEIARALKDGRMHVGISTAHHREPGINYQKLYSERAGLYCGDGHPLFQRAPNRLKIDQLRGLDYVTRGYEEERQSIQKKIQARPTALAYPLEGVAHLILSGRFIGIMPVHFARVWTDRGLMRPILPNLLRNEIDFYLLSKERGREGPLLRAFREALSKCNRKPKATAHN